MIKPADISDQQIESVEQSINCKIDQWNSNSREIVAAILNAAIEAGLVSPPVWTVRDKQVNLLDNDVYGLYRNPDAAKSKHEDVCTAEHRKGQTS